ncbi:MAG: outer membrane lipoprotein carrier protein LolA [Alphaproteobacteria bacterium]|nr:outer membrane lipoprotein carrier protein LolA [Alphaproteobacteria bacterium]
MFIQKKLINISLLVMLLLYSKYSYSSEQEMDLKLLENYLNSINNLAFIFEQKSQDTDKEIGWMQIAKPNKIRIEYEGHNDLIIIANSFYLILYKAKDDIITSLSNDGPWNILSAENIHITSDINNLEANSFVKSIKKSSLNGKYYIVYEILMKNKSNQFSAPIFLYASLDPFKIEGWTIYDNKNKKIIVKITEILNTNKNYLSPDIFSLSEAERVSGKVWHGPFSKDKIIRKQKYRN